VDCQRHARRATNTVSNLRNGHRDRKLKREHRARCRAANAPCWLCGQPIDYAAPPGTPDSFESDHRIPVSIRPDLAYLPSNLMPSHAGCNRSRGANPVESTTAGGPWVRADW